MVFGRENIDIRVYERQRFLNDDSVFDFLDALGLRTDTEYRWADRDFNRYIAPGMRDLKRTPNVLLQEERQGKSLLDKVLLECSQFEPLKGTQPFTEEQRTQLLELCKESDKKVARNYLGDESKPLFGPPEKLKEQQALSKYERRENAVRFFGELFLEHQREVEMKLYLRRKQRYAGADCAKGWRSSLEEPR